MTYIVDFAGRLKSKSNIGIVVYLIINILIVMWLFQNVLLGLAIYVASLVIALSPIGEWILRVQNGCKPVVRKDHIARLKPLFDEVYTKAKELDPSLPEDVKLFISNDKFPNAFATGRKTICLTKGFLEYDDEEIKATLAHEFGHLSNKDTDLILVVTVGNLIVSLLFILYRFFFLIAAAFVGGATKGLGGFVVSFFVDLILVGMMWLWTKLGTALVMHSSRQNEYQADAFAFKAGYGHKLIKVLDSFNEFEGIHTKGLWANLMSSHPEPDIRIAKLQELMDQLEEESSALIVKSTEKAEIL
ncbi:zinc metalloprotease HtpX [Neobacillus sp. D3-1R]|uniref:zinc metalloprotease HtpX n=1 Tax=Neobacillus sp. D3-1R TaxID=3445778 RepID=UPI003F9F34F9